MKKWFKFSVAALALVGTVSVFSACGEKSVTGEAYGLVHGGKYVGCATITKSGDSIKDATLNEICLPDHVTAPDSVAADDKVTVSESKIYYKTVSYGEVTMTYDATAGYKVGDKTLKDYFADAANAKAYYEAVVAGNVSVTVGGQKKTDVMTKKALSKDENGYWNEAKGSKLTAVEGKTFWQLNRDATVKYVKENGVANLTKLVKNDETGFWMDGTVSTGATWTDLNKEGATGYFTYAKLLVAAFDAAK